MNQEIERILDKRIPTLVTCPHCERPFDLTEIDWDMMLKELEELFVNNEKEE